MAACASACRRALRERRVSRGNRDRQKKVAKRAKKSPSPPAIPATGGAPAAASPEPRARLRPPTQAGRHEVLKELLTAAAQRHGLDPGLVLAVAWWESGWDMSKVSVTGASGLMQIDPGTARDLGPQLLHRGIDVHDAYDNADLGAAVLKNDLDDAGGKVDVALASYYEGPGNVDPSNLDTNAQTYVEGVTALQKAFDSGQDPTITPSPAPTPPQPAPLP